MKRNAGKNVRFTSLVSVAGKPRIYLPFSDPKGDPEFVRALKQRRVLTVIQEPVSKKKDFGVVGFPESRHATYLLFPKPLTNFEDARIVGIQYEDLQSAPVPSKTRSPARIRRRQIPKPPPPEPEPKEFRVRLRITRVTEKGVTVAATTKREAKAKAASLADRVARDDNDASVEVRVLGVVGKT